MLEIATQAVVSSLLTHHQSIGLPESGGTLKLSISLSSAPGGTLPLALDLPATSKPINMAVLQRLRRSFVRMHGSGMASVNALGDAARSEAAQEKGDGESVIAKRFALWLCESL
jgi:protein KTI12